MRRIPFLPLILVLAVVVGCNGEDGAEVSGPPSDGAILAMNRGLAALERFEYLPAAEEFEKAVALAPRWTPAKVNLAVAWLNLRGQYHAKAVAICREILAATPADPHANFILAVLLRIGGSADEAIRYIDAVLEADPDDPSSRYWRGLILRDLDRNDEAEAEFARVIELNPYLAAAYYQRYSLLLRKRRPQEAKEAMETSQRLRAPRGAEFPIHGDQLTANAYHEIGKYALAIRTYADAEPPRHRTAEVGVEPKSVEGYRYGGDGGPEFTPVERKEGESDRDYVLRVVSRIGPGVVLGDHDADGDADVFLPEWGGPGKLFRNDAGALVDATAGSGIETSCHGIAGTFFDADGDGDLDLYVTAAGPNVFYRNLGKGRFADATDETGLSGGDLVSIQALPGDFDHEGDVDLFVTNYCHPADPKLAGAPDALFQNSRDGTFTDVAPAHGVSGGGARSVAVLPLDVDRDLDTDLLVLRDRGPALLWLNERIWNFRAGEVPDLLRGAEPCWGAAAGDIDRDGREEVLVFRGPGANATLLTTTEEGKLEVRRGPLSEVRWRTGVFLDADLDGYVDLVGDGTLVLFDGGELLMGDARPFSGNTRGMGFADLDGDGDLDRVVARNDGLRVLSTVAPKANHWIAFDLIGREALQPAAWSARVGPGQELELRAGRLWQPLRARAASGFLSSVEGVARFGLGERTKADLVRIMWPDRVLQVEAEISADQVKRIEELNRKPDSCPMLFAWDGEEFRFVSDFLGVGGLGFFVAPGVYGESDGDEYVRIGEWARPVSGDYVLQITEPLEEISYLDETTLVVVDHPDDMEVYPNERYVGIPELFPEPRLYGVRKKIFPKSARSIDGEDVLARIREVDRIYAPVVADRRFAGVAEEHAVVLDFTGRVPEVPEGSRLVLFADGWVEYGYSHTVFAAWQAGIEHLAPTIEVPDGKGGWETLVENAGFPAGLPKGSTVDLTGLVTPERPIIRVRSNLEVFWDRLFIGVDEAPGVIRVTRLDPRVAHLHDRGYQREYSPDGRLPIVYDYGLTDPGFPFKNMAGSYTKFGEVTPLVTETDDMYVIMGRGEELTLRYPESALPVLPEGWVRTTILHATGWCKDMDPYTAFPDTVEPLPFRGMSGYPYGDGEKYPDDAEHRAYRERWNTRRVYGR